VGTPRAGLMNNNLQHSIEFRTQQIPCDGRSSHSVRLKRRIFFHLLRDGVVRVDEVLPGRTRGGIREERSARETCVSG
jgi:hypothetical protein